MSSSFEKMAGMDKDDLRVALDEALELLSELVDPDPCDLDHHGGCQAHGQLSLNGQVCPHERAKALLKEYYEDEMSG